MGLDYSSSEQLDAEQQYKTVLYYAALGTVLVGIIGSGFTGYTLGKKDGKLEMRQNYESNIESIVTNNIRIELKVKDNENPKT